jgi:hypothetical protein
MNKKIQFYLAIGLILLVTGCAPFQCEVALFQYNDYTLANSKDEVSIVHTNEPKSTKTESYGNNNRAVVKQSMILYKSPTTNSSNSVPVTLPLMGM